MTKEDAKYYEEKLQQTINLYFKKEINLNAFVTNENLRNSLNYFFTNVLRQTNINFACSDCISTAIRHSNAMYENYKIHHEEVKTICNNLSIAKKENKSRIKKKKNT